MFLHKKLSLLTTFIIVVSFSFVSICSKQVLGEVKQITDTKEQLEGITEEEKATLEDLFTLTQQIQELEAAEAKITEDIKHQQIKIKDMESSILERQKDYDSQLEILKQVLVGYQRSGPVSYLDTLLSAGDLKTFLMSINIMRDLTHNVGDLLDSLEAEKKLLLEEKEKLAENLKFMEVKKKE